MSFAIVRGFQGAMVQMVGEGSSGTPVDFEHFYQGCKDLGGGLQQYPKVYGSGTAANPYELCENNASEWSVSGDIGTPVDEGVDVSKNSYSIKATKSGSGACVMMWNENGTFDSEFGASYHMFNPECADRIIFEIKPSNAAIQLDAIKIWTDSNSSGHDAIYDIRHTNGGSGWTLSAGVWNEFELMLRDFDDPNYRFYAKYINRIDFEFSGGVNLDTILIDGLRFEHPDAGIKKIGASTYVSTYPLRMNTCYFKQEYGINLDIVPCAGFYGYGGFHLDSNYQMDWGGLGYGDGEPLFPINITFDFIETDSYNIRLISNNTVDSLFNNVNITCFTWMERHGVTGSTPGAFYASGTKQYKFNNCKIISGDIYTNNRTEFRNCILMGFRYPIWGPDAVLENVKIVNLISSYAWVDYGELRNANFVDWHAGVQRTVIYNRQYRQVTPRTLTVIDLSHDMPDPEHVGLQLRKYWITEEQRVVDQITEFGFTMNVKVKNAAGDLLEDAVVKLVDQYDATIFEVNTDVNGVIVEQDVIIVENNLDDPLPDDGSHVHYLYPWREIGSGFDTIYYPFVLTINKSGYAEYRDDNFKLWAAYDQEIVLQLTTAETVLFGSTIYGSTIQ